MSKNMNVPKLRFKEFDGVWEEKKLIDTVDNSIKWSFTGGPFGSDLKSDDYTEMGVRIIQLQNIGDGSFINEYSIFTSEEKADKLLSCNIYPNEIIISKMGDPVARACKMPSTDRRYIMASDGIRFVPDEENYSKDFIFFSINHPSFRKKALINSTGSTRKRIGLTELRNINFYLPSKQEQEKIASFLTSVDTKIEQLTRKKELLQQYKKGVMQKIFNQEVRFKADSGSEFPNWKKEKLNKYLVEYKNKSTFENEYPVLTSSNKGLMLQSDYFGENRLTERDNIGFNIVPCNFITYRSRSDNRSFTFNINELGYTGIISTYYPVFECKNADNRFVVTLLNKNKHLIGKYSVGTSQTVLSFNELKNIKMLIPSVQEQTKIANFLSSIDSKIEQVQKQLNSIKEFKKALLQQMFV